MYRDMSGWLRWPVHAGAALTMAAALGAAAPRQAPRISEAEISARLQRNADCEHPDQIHIDRLEYFDFTGDGRAEAVVVASTCMTGTAGPDIHAVFTRTASGALEVLPFDGDTRGEDGAERFVYELKDMPVFGNPNFSLRVEAGQLVARWMDGSDRPEPVVIWFKWDGRRFVRTRSKIEGPFPTSYDCSKASAEMDRAICYSPSVAALDVLLGEAYRARLRRLPPNQRRALQDDERRWLAQRAQTCTIYKWWVECLTEAYNTRIKQLKTAGAS